MSTNNYKPHLHIIVEDEPYEQLANGFLLNPDINENAIQVRPIIGGWENVIGEFKDVHIREMKKYDERRFALIIDFDNKFEKRLNFIKNKIPAELHNRVFILGVLLEAEDLKRELNAWGYEKIGIALSQDCSDNTRKTWNHALLKHNKDELDRMVELVKPFLFNQK